MMSTKNPYSAEHPVPPDRFTGRIHQIGEFDHFLADTVEGNSKRELTELVAKDMIERALSWQGGLLCP